MTLLQCAKQLFGLERPKRIKLRHLSRIEADSQKATIKMLEAVQVINKVIREQVPRPKRLPRATECDGTRLRFYTTPAGYILCPMGLLPEAKSPCPTGLHNFGKPPGSEYQIIQSWVWWDSLTDPQAAVDAVWGEST